MTTAVAFERGTGYSPALAADAAGTPAGVVGVADDMVGTSLDVVGAAVDAVDRALDRRIDELTDEQITGELDAWETVRRRLDARVARLARGLSSRRIRRARDTAPPGDAERAGQRAARETRRELTDRLNWSPGQARRTDDQGRRLETLPSVGAAADRGELTARHTKILADTLRYLEGSDRDELERELIAAAATQDPTTFGRTCRRRLGEIDPDALTLDHDLKQQRRRATVTESDDGMLRLDGQWTGLDAETIATAIHAFRRPDPTDQTRTPGQRTADAIVDLARAALNGAQAPADRGARPHINLTIPIGLLENKAGIAEGSWTGPICYDTLRAVLDDVGLGWIVTDRGGLPLEAGPGVRTVPTGLWRILTQRDRSCIRDGCDTPASWCDVMHLDRSFAQGGRLSPDNAALGCRHHHRLYDTGRLQLHWHDNRPALRPPRSESRTHSASGAGSATVDTRRSRATRRSIGPAPRQTGPNDPRTGTLPRWSTPARDVHPRLQGRPPGGVGSGRAHRSAPMEWRPVELDTWNDLYMVVRSVLAELPPGTALLLRPGGDERAAHITARPRPRFEVRAGERQLAVLPCRSETDIIDHLRSNLEDHWEVDHPTLLEHRFSEQVSPRLSSAFADDEIVRDLPEAERPRPSSHTSGEQTRDDLASRIDPDVMERLRQMGSSALD